MVISIAYPVADITIFFLVGLGYDTVVIIVGVGDHAASGEYDLCHVAVCVIAVFRP